MITLYLDGTQVYPDVSQNIKLTDQNPYFKLAGSYTLDVTFPMDILANREFFRNINRMEISKTAQSMKCVLMADNSVVMDGLAHITEVTENSVKVQLEGGNSEISFLSEDAGMYIDEMDLSSVYQTTMHVWLDAVSAELELKTPNLVSLIGSVMSNCGFRIVENFLNQTPWNMLFIVPKDATDIIQNQLPHWKASEFVLQVSRLFNVTFVADARLKTVRILSNSRYLEYAGVTELNPMDEYKVEVSQEDGEAEVDVLANANLSYSFPSSEYHEYDCLPDDVRKKLEKRVYGSFLELFTNVNLMSPGNRRRFLFLCPGGCYAIWNHDALWIDGQSGESLTYMDCFRPLERNNTDKDGNIELKIVPGAKRLGYQTFHVAPNFYVYVYLDVPATTGSDDGYNYYMTGETVPMTVQEAVEEGVEKEEDKDSKDDVMEIVFQDSNFQHVYRKDSVYNTAVGGEVEEWTGPSSETGNEITIRSNEYKWANFFSDWKLKPGLWEGTPSRHWSLSLNPTDADHYIGELHNNPYTLNVKARHVFQILSDKAIDPTDVFIIRGKRYMCEKIESNIKDGVFDKVKTGYFYEILS